MKKHDDDEEAREEEEERGRLLCEVFAWETKRTNGQMIIVFHLGFLLE